MTTLEWIVAIVLLAAALFLIVAVLMQHGKSHGLSGTIAGGAETFFGKEKGRQFDKKLGRVTTVVGILFVLTVLVLYIAQPELKSDYTGGGAGNSSPYGQTTETETNSNT